MDVVSLHIQLVGKTIITLKEPEEDLLATSSMFGAHLDVACLSQVMALSFRVHQQLTTLVVRLANERGFFAVAHVNGIHASASPKQVLLGSRAQPLISKNLVQELQL